MILVSLKGTSWNMISYQHHNFHVCQEHAVVNTCITPNAPLRLPAHGTMSGGKFIFYLSTVTFSEIPPLDTNAETQIHRHTQSHHPTLSKV